MKRHQNLAYGKKNFNRGFALPTVLGIGLILLLVGLTMIFRSLGDRQIAYAQGATAQSLVVAETGITRIQGLLLKYPGLAANSLKDWSVEVAETPPQVACNQQSSSTAAGNSTSSGQTSDGQASDGQTPAPQLPQNQTPNPQTPNAQTSSASPSPSPTPTPISVSFEDEKTLTRITNDTPNDDWFNIGNDSRQGEFKILSYDVVGNFGQLKIQGKVGEFIRSANSSVQVDMPLEFADPSPPGIWVSASADQPEPISIAANRSLKATVWVEDTDKSFEIDTYPKNLMSCDKFEGGKCDTYKFQESSGSRPKPPEIKPGSEITNNPNAHQLVGTTLGKPKLTLPQPNDKADSDGTYRYLIQGDLSMIKDSEVIINPPQGTKVIFYLEKNMSIAGNAKLNNAGSVEGFEIYGSSSSQDYDDDSGTVTAQISLSSQNTVNAFIYAPEAEVKIQGQASLKGAIWSKTLSSTGTAANVIAVSQLDCLKDLAVGDITSGGANQTAKVRPPKSWQRQPAS
jgi:hypothetical protein